MEIAAWGLRPAFFAGKNRLFKANARLILFTETAYISLGLEAAKTLLAVEKGMCWKDLNQVGKCPDAAKVPDLKARNWKLKVQTNKSDWVLFANLVLE